MQIHHFQEHVIRDLLFTDDAESRRRFNKFHLCSFSHPQHQPPFVLCKSRAAAEEKQLGKAGERVWRTNGSPHARTQRQGGERCSASPVNILMCCCLELFHRGHSHLTLTRSRANGDFIFRGTRVTRRVSLRCRMCIFLSFK